ncbi:RNA polymerase sigma factor [Streptomyces sp. NPDC060000]|uniref:RNA polymerase sigma factor n=1 Tax=Streptomyces sp. NPDC060000 TaxID=3347031 RepID=UPI0036A42DEA
MSSSPEISTRTTGAYRAHREARDSAAARTLAQWPPARYEPYLDGLFTYCLSVLCDHDAATAALGNVLAFAERRGQRVPDTAGDRRAWLYALARWACLRKLTEAKHTEAKQKRQGTHAAARDGARRQRSTKPANATAFTAPAISTASATSFFSAASTAAEVPTASDEAGERRRRELTLLAWPEAAGTTPEQREALELAVRHHLAAHEVAAVLGKDLAAARELLASAACEVERTRAALAVVETGGCPGVARLTGEHQLVLSAAVRRELVRHVDDCPRCRRAAERAVPGRWPGAGVTPAELPVLQAPRAELHVAMARLTRARGAAVPRYDRRGFPMDPKDRAARRERLRARAVTTTVVATVVAAPVLALWAAYRGTPTGEGAESRSVGTSEAHGADSLDGETVGGYENAGNASTRPGTGSTKNNGPDVSVEVVSVTGLGRSTSGPLSVTVANSGDTTLITLTAGAHGEGDDDGDGPVRWSATTAASWLYLSRSTGSLKPGESVTIKVYVDHLREPSGHWHARVAIAPAGAVVSIEGYGTASGPSGPGNGPGHGGPPPSSGPEPTPTSPPSPDPAPTDPPASSDPEPTPGDPSPTTSEDSPPPSDDNGPPSPATP